MQESSTNGPMFGVGLGPGQFVQTPRLVRLWTIWFVLVVVLLPAVPATASVKIPKAVITLTLSILIKSLGPEMAAQVWEKLMKEKDINKPDNLGRTLLMYTVDGDAVSVVKLLLAKQADPNVRAPDGATALSIAASHGHSEIIAMLMQAGANPTIKGPNGKTAMEVAREKYGDPLTALKQGESSEVIALLKGKMWAEEEALVRKLRESQPGSIFRDCDRCPEMLVIPAGRFLMGDLSGTVDSNKRPVHEVTIAAPFAVGKYEVTFDEWDACVAAGGCTYRPGDHGWGRGNRPVIDVSWNDVQKYVQWLSRETGKVYRLLSEAEWEYVARAGSATNYPWGDALGTNQANCDGCGSRWDAKRTAPVGSFEANAFGVFDIGGNVWEWVEDCWNDSYRGAPSDSSAWTIGDCGRHVVRGGSWNNLPRYLRSVGRYWNDTDTQLSYNGFRVAWTFAP